MMVMDWSRVNAPLLAAGGTGATTSVPVLIMQ